MNKRILSLFLVFALCLTLMPSAVFAEAEPNAGESLTVGAAVGQNAGGSAVAESGGTEYETLRRSWTSRARLRSHCFKMSRKISPFMRRRSLS